MVNAVLGTAAFYGDQALFERFLAEFKKTDDKQVRERLIGAMGSFRDPAAIETGMKALLQGEVPFMEGPFLLFNGQASAATRKLPLTFLKAHYREVTSKMPTGGTFEFGAFLPHVGDSYCDAASKAELETFLRPQVEKYSDAPRTLTQVLEAIDLCIASQAAQQPSVARFLKAY